VRVLCTTFVTLFDLITLTIRQQKSNLGSGVRHSSCHVCHFMAFVRPQPTHLDWCGAYYISSVQRC